MRPDDTLLEETIGVLKRDFASKRGKLPKIAVDPTIVAVLAAAAARLILNDRTMPERAAGDLGIAIYEVYKTLYPKEVADSAVLIAPTSTAVN